MALTRDQIVAFRRQLCKAIKNVWDEHWAADKAKVHSYKAIMNMLESDPDFKYGPYKNTPNLSATEIAQTTFHNAEDAVMVHVYGQFDKWLFPDEADGKPSAV